MSILNVNGVNLFYEVLGSEDLLKRPKFSKIIHDNIKNSEYVIIPECGHVAIFEKVEEVKSILLGFILKHIAS
jgi:3-oxoadipate enol-lactonase